MPLFGGRADREKASAKALGWGVSGQMAGVFSVRGQ